MESLHAELSRVVDPANYVPGSREASASGSWPLVGHFTFLEDLKKMKTSGPRTLKKSVDCNGRITKERRKLA